VTALSVHHILTWFVKSLTFVVCEIPHIRGQSRANGRRSLTDQNQSDARSKQVKASLSFLDPFSSTNHTTQGHSISYSSR
jgi:hypothetical protein